jgi:hypothetical protein
LPLVRFWDGSGRYGADYEIRATRGIVETYERHGRLPSLPDQLAENRAAVRRAGSVSLLRMLTVRRYTYFGTLRWRINEARRITALLHEPVD